MERTRPKVETKSALVGGAPHRRRNEGSIGAPCHRLNAIFQHKPYERCMERSRPKVGGRQRLGRAFPPLVVPSPPPPIGGRCCPVPPPVMIASKNCDLWHSLVFLSSICKGWGTKSMSDQRLFWLRRGRSVGSLKLKNYHIQRKLARPSASLVTTVL